jgi:hypothetical protein
MVSGKVCGGSGVFGGGWASGWAAGLEEVEEFVENARVVAGSVGVAKLGAYNDLTG